MVHLSGGHPGLLHAHSLDRREETPWPPHSPPCSALVRWEGQGEPRSGGNPQPTCSIRGPQGPGDSRSGEALLRAEGTSLTGRSLPGLTVGLRTQVQAGESVPGPSSLLLWGQGSLPGCGEGKGSSGFTDRWEVWRSGLRIGPGGRLVSLPLISFQGPSPNLPSGLSRALWSSGGAP